MLNILVVYWHAMPQLRTTTHDHLLCFERYLPHQVYSVNLADAEPSWCVQGVDFDVIIYHDLFFCGRWGERALFEKLCSKIAGLKSSRAVKIAVPQDEFIYANLLCAFINDFGVDAVFSVAPPSEWPKIYRDVDRNKVKFHFVLTGYLEEQTLTRITAITAAAPERTIEIGYRAGGRNWRQAAWLGRHGILKIAIADRFAEAAPRYGISTDISTRGEDVFMGDDWYRFLARCRYTIGLEGGASVLDWDGSVRLKTLAYVAENPEASLEVIEAACFPGLDGQFALFALSPRHLEACATRTCQILIEGDYGGALVAGRHYIALKRDFSNLDAVLQMVRHDDLREQIVEAAYQDVVASGRYTYQRFAAMILAEAEKIRPELLRPKSAAILARDAENYQRYQDEKNRPAPDQQPLAQWCAAVQTMARLAVAHLRGWVQHRGRR
jgi:hypothetical protein